MSKRYDLVVFGATGFTGSLVCKYLVSHPRKPSWAVAGRSASRLSSLKSKLNLPDSVGVIEAETSEYSSLTSMAAQAKVVINIVGPYRPFKAEEVVRACVEQGANYVDLSGETGFNADIIEKFHLDAQANRVTIACSVGFDSLPFDLSTYLAAQKAMELTGGKSKVKLAECAYILPDSLSAGTLASAISMASEPDQMRNVRGDWLSPIAKPGSLTYSPVHYFPQRNKWGAHNIFTLHNTRTVNRTWGLLEHHHSPNAYGQAFIYKEGALVPNKLAAYIFSYVQFIGVWFLMNFSLVRWFMSKSMAPNSGPTDKSLYECKFRVDTVATADDGTKAICTMKGTGNAGYLLTSRMIVETALTIIDDPKIKQNPLGKGVKGGVLTPALVGADRLAQRLVEYGQIEIITEKYEEKKSK